MVRYAHGILRFSTTRRSSRSSYGRVSFESDIKADKQRAICLLLASWPTNQSVCRLSNKVEVVWTSLTIDIHK